MFNTFADPASQYSFPGQHGRGYQRRGGGGGGGHRGQSAVRGRGQQQQLFVPNQSAGQYGMQTNAMLHTRSGSQQAAMFDQYGGDTLANVAGLAGHYDTAGFGAQHAFADYTAANYGANTDPNYLAFNPANYTAQLVAQQQAQDGVGDAGLEDVGRPNETVQKYNATLAEMSGNLPQLQQQLKTMERMGKVDSESYAIALKAHHRLGKIPQMEKLMERLGHSGIVPNAECFDEVLTAFANQRNLEKIREYLNLMRTYRIRLPLRSYNLLIDTYGKAGELQKMQELFQEIAHVGLQPNNITHNTILFAYGKANKRELMDRFFEQCPEAVRDTQTYNTVIDAHSRAGEIDVMESYFHRLLESGHQPDIRTYNSLFSAYAKSNDTMNLMKHVLQMEKAGIQPNTGTFNILIGIFGKTGQLSVMEKFYEALTRMYNLTPDVFTFNSMLMAYGKSQRRDKVEEMWQLMEHYGVQPNVASYQNIIEAFHRLGDIDMMEKYYEESKRMGLGVWAHVSMLTAYCDKKDIQKMEALWTNMQRRKIQPNVLCYNAMIKAYAEVPNVEMMEKYFHGLVASQGNRPDCNTFCAIIKGYCNVYNLDKAVEVYRAMNTLRIRPDCNIFRALLEGFYSIGDTNSARVLWNDIPASFKDLEVSTSYINALLQLNKVDDAIAILTEVEAQQAGGEPVEELVALREACQQLLQQSEIP